MATLSDEGRRVVSDIAARHGFGADAVTHMALALANGGGSQAQFGHPEFGGMGQWSQGGMVMIGDMFNSGLKARVDSLCCDLAAAMRSGDVLAYERPYQNQNQSQSQMQGGGSGSSLFVPGGQGGGSGWPAALGHPASQGSQNDMRYAYFPEKSRLAISVGGTTTVYDTGDHRIGGFGQSQSGDRSLSFTSQHGLVQVADLAVVDPGRDTGADTQRADTGIDMPGPADAAMGAAAMPGGVGDAAVMEGDRNAAASAGDAPMTGGAMPGTPPIATPMAGGDDGDAQIFARLERLADFHGRGILSDEEFSAKKAELLARL